MPIGEAAVVRAGDDVTVVSVSRWCTRRSAAAEQLAAEGISVEVIDLRTVGPLDKGPILESVARRAGS